LYSIKKQNRRYCLGKTMKCPTIKTPLEGPFYCYLVCPNEVKVAKIAPWGHHSQVKPESPKWEYIPDPASPSKITLQNTCTRPWKDPTSWETTGDHEQWDNSPALVTLEAD
jgi:hypothetical protein